MKLKVLREARGWTQTALAKKIGLTQAYITMLEKGDKVNPTLATLKKLAKALKVKPSALLD